MSLFPFTYPIRKAGFIYSFIHSFFFHLNITNSPPQKKHGLSATRTHTNTIFLESGEPGEKPLTHTIAMHLGRTRLASESPHNAPSTTTGRPVRSRHGGQALREGKGRHLVGGGAGPGPPRALRVGAAPAPLYSPLPTEGCGVWRGGVAAVATVASIASIAIAVRYGR